MGCIKGISVPQLEIEKRYLLTSDNIEKILRNDFIEFKKEELEQFYLVATIEKTLRYRKEGSRYIKNSKKGSGLVREESEDEVTEIEYKEAKSRRKGGIIKKCRYSFSINNWNFELDIFKGKLKGLRILEVEFNDIEEANSFKMPEILRALIIKEITNESIYSNGALSKSMQIPLRADAKLSYKQIADSESKKLPQFDIYISKYENAKFALQYTLKRLLLSLDLQINDFLENESITHLLLAYKALERYRTLLKAFKKYIKKRYYLEQLYSVNSLLLSLEKTVEIEKSFLKLLKCKKRYPLKEQNRVLKTLIELAQLRNEEKEKLLESNLLEKVTYLQKMKLKTKKSLEKPFDYIAYRVKKCQKRAIKRAIDKGVDTQLLYSKLKEYKLLLQFTSNEKLQNIGYKRLKKSALNKKYKRIVEKINKSVAKDFLFYCTPKIRTNKIYKLISKEL